MNLGPTRTTVLAGLVVETPQICPGLKSRKLVRIFRATHSGRIRIRFGHTIDKVPVVLLG